jgi:glycosyltransferase involved in cell wall biosynthesis
VRHLCVAIPAFNEAAVLGETLARIPRTLAGAEAITLLVIDDGSIDDTAAVARAVGDPRVVLVRHAINRGLGAAIATAFAWARAAGCDGLVTYDADGQHAPEDLAAVAKALSEGDADVVIGSRMKDSRGMPWYRVAGNWGLNIATWVLFGVWTTDSQSGLRGFNRRALESIVLRQDRMAVSSELIKERRARKLRGREVPIRAIYTDYSLRKGQRSVNGVHIVLRLLLDALLGGD